VYRSVFSGALPWVVAVFLAAPAVAAIEARTAPDRATAAATSPFNLDWSCGYLYESPAEAELSTCAPPAKDRMPKLITKVRRAAGRGSAYDQFVLGMAHWQGDRAPLDPVRALMWLNLAAEQTLEVAAHARDALRAQLSAGEVAAARRLADHWRQRRDGQR
jgi:hypothetical protein